MSAKISIFSQEPMGFESSEELFSKRHRYLITQPNNEWHDKIIRRLEHLTRLEKGWDGYQGEPVSFENANFTLKVLEAICSNCNIPCPQLVPGYSGDLQVEWHTQDCEIELHVIAPNNVEAWVLFGDKEEEYELSTDFTVIAQLMQNMTEHTGDKSASEK